MVDSCNRTLLMAEQLELFTKEPVEPVEPEPEPEPEWVYSRWITINGKRTPHPQGKVWRFRARPGWKRKTE